MGQADLEGAGPVVGVPYEFVRFVLRCGVVFGPYEDGALGAGTVVGEVGERRRVWLSGCDRQESGDRSSVWRLCSQQDVEMAVLGRAIAS